MTVFFPVKLRVDVWLQYGLSVAVSICGFALLFVGGLWLFSGRSSSYVEMGRDLALSSKSAFVKEAIGQGPLSLRPAFARGWVARLADEVQALSYNSRPDQLMKESKMVIQLKKGKELRTMSSGSLVYLQEAKEGEGLLFSQEATSLWMRPTLLDNKTVLVEVGRLCGASAEEKGQFLAQFQGMRTRADSALQKAVDLFSGSCAFLQDLVVGRYAGKEFAAWKQKVSLEISGENGVYGLRVAKGDLLGFRDGRWEVVDFETAKGLDLIGQVVSVSEQGVDLALWDEKGFSTPSCRVEVKKRVGGPLGAEFLPSAVRLRTGTQVSALLGKRRLILRAGDWLIRRQNGWRHLRSVEEIQAYLDRQIKGELFVFEAVEKDPQGKATIKGTLFDETRTWMQPVSVPVGSEKAPSNTKSQTKRRSNRGGK